MVCKTNKKYEYKLYNQQLMTKIPMTSGSAMKNYKTNMRDGEEEINKIAEDGWELFSTHVTAFNMLVFIFKRERK